MNAREAALRDVLDLLVDAANKQLSAISSVPVETRVSEVGPFVVRTLRSAIPGPHAAIQVGWAGEELGALGLVDRQFMLQAAGLIAGKEAPLTVSDRGDLAELEGMIRLSLDALAEAWHQHSGREGEFGSLKLDYESSLDVSPLTGFEMALLDVTVGQLASRIVVLISPSLVADLIGDNQTEGFPSEQGDAGEVHVRPGVFPALEEQSYAVGGTRSLDLLMDIELPVSVELGRVNMTIRSILGLGPGAVVELDKFSGEPVDLLVNNKKFAEGEVVVVDQNFGVRITALVGASERLNAAREGRPE